MKEFQEPRGGGWRHKAHGGFGTEGLQRSLQAGFITIPPLPESWEFMPQPTKGFVCWLAF